MRDKDQEARLKALTFFTKKDKLAPIPKESKIGKEITKIDHHHNAKLKETIKIHGWPGHSLIGEDGTEAFWLLVQHQDEDINFQKECISLLEEAVKNGEASKQSLAYLIDRVRKNEGLPQIYGTQFVDKNGKMSLYPVEDPEGLDERRKEMNLEPWIKYKQLMQDNLQLQEDAFE